MKAVLRIRSRWLIVASTLFLVAVAIQLSRTGRPHSTEFVLEDYQSDGTPNRPAVMLAYPSDFVLQGRPDGDVAVVLTHRQTKGIARWMEENLGNQRANDWANSTIRMQYISDSGRTIDEQERRLRAVISSPSSQFT